MPWPSYVCNNFDAIPGGVNGATDESMFYGPYNTLLGCLFPATDYYVVTPQFTPTFLVQKASRPVFFLDIKPPAHYTHRSSRAAADAQMRTQFYALADVVELPVIHGVSALGTHVCFYSYNRDNAVVDPPPIPADVNQMNDVAPAARWNFDVLSDEGVARMTQVANEVKAMVAQHAW